MNQSTLNHIASLHVDLHKLAHKFLNEAQGCIAQLDFSPPSFPWQSSTLEITSSVRDIELQAGLWSQGRTWDKDKRKWLVVSEGHIVTRTLKSKHIDGKAFDIAPLYQDKYHWDWFDPKKEENKVVWLKLAQLGRSMGLKPGAFFTKPDWPHFEL